MASFLVGLLCPFAVGLTVLAGRRYWARTRQAQALAADEVVTGAQVAEPPRPASPQDSAAMGRVRYGASVPGRRRHLRGHGPDRNG